MLRQTVCALAIATLALAGAPARAELPNREFGELKKALKRALKMGQWATAAAKVREIAQDDTERALDALTDVARVPDPAVYEAARDGVASMRSADVEEAIRKLLSKSGGSPIDKILVIDAMSERADAFAEEVLGLAMGARQAEVQRAALNAVRGKKMVGAIDGMIELLESLERKNEDGLNANLIRELLNDLTGEAFETAEDWRKFWSTRRGNFRRPVTGSAKPKGETRRRERPTFFGSEIKSNRLVFVIDTSGSMTAADPPSTGTGGGHRRGPQTGGGSGGQRGGPGGAPPGADSRVRIERAKQQLAQVIEALPSDARFTILAYSGVLVQGPSGVGLPPGADPNKPLPPKLGGFEWLKIWKPKLLPATDGNKTSARKFVASLQANGGTFTFNALRSAFEVDGADTIVVLSDGMPNDVDPRQGQPMTNEQILDQVGALNRFKRCVIDTFGFDPAGGAPAGHGGSMPGGFGGGLGKFMQDLAKQNGGEYTQIQ